MSVRSSIMKALARSERRAAGESNVVPFPGPKKSRVKRRQKPKAYKRITDAGNGQFMGRSGKHTDYFERVEIGGKPYMRRSDGALFKLRKDGSWVLTAEPRSGGRKKSLLPYAIGAGAVGAGTAGGIYASQYRKK